MMLADGIVLFPVHDGEITEKSIPPLGEFVFTIVGGEYVMLMSDTDVLMVWHAFMLNPSKYEKFCWKSSRKNAWSVDFPWALIVRIFPSYPTHEYQAKPISSIKHSRTER